VSEPRSAQGQRTLPGEYFTSEGIFRREQERIFARRWLCAGHVSELSAPGSYLLFELGTESVILLRDRGGGLRALRNVCRHRGSRLCLEPAGELGGAIRCPYHAWTYELDGTLRAAPNMAEVAGFDVDGSVVVSRETEPADRGSLDWRLDPRHGRWRAVAWPGDLEVLP